MSYELVDDFVRQADARPVLTALGTGSPARAWSKNSTPEDLPARPMVKRLLAAAKPQPAIMKRPVYLCPELGRTCHRAGAYDAYDLPSLYNGELKPYRFSDE